MSSTVLPNTNQLYLLSSTPTRSPSPKQGPKNTNRSLRWCHTQFTFMTSAFSLFETCHAIASITHDIGRKVKGHKTWPLDVDFAIREDKVDTPDEDREPKCQERIER